MYDKSIALEKLQHIEFTIQTLLDSTASITDGKNLLLTPDGMLRLNGIYMLLLAIGEEIKGLDKHTNKELLPLYPDIHWKEFMGLRDRIAHGYFELDVDIIFDTLRNDIPPLLPIIQKMQQNL